MSVNQHKSPKRREKLLRRCAELCVGRGYGLAFALTGRKEDAEDLVQETLLIATSKVDLLKANPWPWLAATIANLARNHTRKAHRRQENRAFQIRASDQALESLESGPLERAVANELNERLWQAIQGLEEAERQTLALVHLAGLSRREAAKQRGISPTSLRRELDGAMAKLSAQMKLPSKTLHSALPLLAAAIPGAGFTASLASSTKPLISITSGMALGGGVVGALIGGLMMKKLALLICAILLLLFGSWASIGLLSGDAPETIAKAPDQSQDSGSADTQQDLPRPQPEVADLSGPAGVDGEAKELSQNAPAEDDQPAAETNLGPRKEPDQRATDISESFYRILVTNEDDEPLPDAKVSASIVSEGPLPKVTTIFAGRPVDAEGVLLVPLDDLLTATRKGGKVTFGALAHGYRYKSVEFDQPTSNPLFRQIKLKTKMKGVEFLVDCVNQRGEPLEGVTVALAQEEKIFREYKATSDATGRATIRAVQWKEDWWDGSYSVVATHRRWSDQKKVSYARVPIESPHKKGATINLVMDLPTIIRGTVLLANGKAAQKAEVTIRELRSLEVGQHRSLTNGWSTTTLTNDNGGFVLRTAKIECAKATVEWRAPDGLSSQKGSTSVVRIDQNNIIDLGVTTLIPTYSFSVVTDFKEKRLMARDYSLQIRRGSNVSTLGWRADVDGTLHVENMSEAELSNSFGGSAEIRAQSVEGVSEWKAVREAAMRGGETIKLTITPTAKGILEFFFTGAIPVDAKLTSRIQLNLVEGELGSFSKSYTVYEGMKFGLAPGQYQLAVHSTPKGRLIQGSRVQVYPGALTPVELKLVETSLPEGEGEISRECSPTRFRTCCPSGEKCESARLWRSDDGG